MTSFIQLHDYIQTIFESSIMQAGTKMEINTSSKIENKKKVISNIDALSHYQFQFVKNCSYSSVSTDTFAAAKMLLL